jgi:hypothetical protein
VQAVYDPNIRTKFGYQDPSPAVTGILGEKPKSMPATLKPPADIAPSAAPAVIEPAEKAGNSTSGPA